MSFRVPELVAVCYGSSRTVLISVALLSSVNILRNRVALSWVQYLLHFWSQDISAFSTRQHEMSCLLVFIWVVLVGVQEDHYFQAAPRSLLEFLNSSTIP